ncbi:heavy metal translocating P-type ATPase [Micrococcaceae sp. AOP34-BR2-30]
MSTSTPNPETSPETSRRLTLDITGMSCASCVQRVERKLTGLPGVEASVNLPLNRATVTAPPETSDDELIAAVGRAGYDARVAPDPHHSHGAHHGQHDGEHTDHAAHDQHEHHDPHDHMNHGPSASTLKPRLIVAGALTLPLFIISMFPGAQFPHWAWVALVLATPVTFWAAWPFHRAAAKAARHFSSTMDTLVSIGVTAAWLFSTVELVLDPGMTAHAGHHTGAWWDMSAMAHHHLYYETAAVVTTFLLLGRWLEDRAKTRAGAALDSLLKLGAQTATVLRDGVETTIAASDLTVGEEFIVRPGEKIATDGTVVSGNSQVDASLVTGESVPVDVAPHDEVIGATINTSGRLVVRATRTGADTTLARMGQLVSDAQSAKAPIARLADRISAVFVPIVLVIAVITVIAWLVFSGDIHSAFRAAVAVLVIACPCALGLATPVGLLAGTGRASQLGILIRGPEVLEDTRAVDTIVLDKTGTVTEGVMSVSEVLALPADGTVQSTEEPVHDDATVLTLAAAVESYSEHSIARAIAEAGRERATPSLLPEVRDFTSTAGGGVVGTLTLHGTEHRVAAGRSTFIAEQLNGGALTDAHQRALAEAEARGATAVWVSVDGAIAGIISLQDTIKPTSAGAIAEFRELGLRPILLTGDNETVARQVAEEVGIRPDDVYAGVRPEDKVAKVRELQEAGRVVAMVGDGVNDAPALAQADLGIAMGSGTDVARDAAEITVMGSSLTQVAQSVRLSRKTLGVIKTNLFWAFLYNTAGIPVAALGFLNPMLAGVAMAASSVLVVANSLRLTRFGRS